MRFAGIAVVLLVLAAPVVIADRGTIKLLALVEDGTNSTGILADLDLETRPGTERVFLETFPLTKIATQISMRFAQQVACNELDADCSGTDFFFTIRASPGIVGGPSAGAAAAVLASALVDDRTLDPGVGVTGTINSGGLIGPVGGISQKIEAAAKGGLKTVLIPKGAATQKVDGWTVDHVKLGNELGIRVIEVATLDEALRYTTGRGIPHAVAPFTIDPAYAATMRQVALDLCNRGRDLFGVPEDDVVREQFLNLSTAADTLFAQGEYYSAASYCFRANLALRREELEERDWELEEFKEAVANTLADVLKLQSDTDRKELRTVTDVQTYMLVKERIVETLDALAPLGTVRRATAREARELAYAQERAFSGLTWSRFFGIAGQAQRVDNQTLIRSCQSKLGEAEERYNYVQSFFPQSLKETRRTLDRATEDAKQGRYVLCLHQAAKAKSEADVVLSVTGVDEDRVQEIVDVKLNATARSLARAQSKEIFPLIGYSYYEYAKALRDEDPYSALLFAEYANEMSSLDIYFGRPARYAVDPRILEVLVAFGVGALAGGLFVLALLRKRRKRRQTR